ncbi:PASTA domain-containing protein [Saccharothrix sp. NRRL B-16314]|uniref:PASTA domain-containing protein n=1 Tax=Saccharothrix sp. NRRL B-16314 TaxID=1463825 RepID=UPI0007C55DFC|nr:PASTA domain-containing protein [Saccharothrix sp. NRRL B-16314]
MSQLKWVAGALTALVVAGCGTTPPATTTVTVPAATTPAATEPAATAPAATEPAATEPVAKTCTVPNVVGMIHQTAQDTMQAAGLFMLREQDATGQGRVLALDRNWTTTAQTPAAGQVVPCDTEVLLSAKKNDE